MTPELFLAHALSPALSLLPAHMDSVAARAMLIAIGLQESGLKTRQQFGGPARGYLQFERLGVAGVLTHHTVGPLAARALAKIDVGTDVSTVYAFIGYNDVVACVLGRLLLWTEPQPLPWRDYPQDSWDQYIDLWRPGKPHRETWDAYYEQAWNVVTVEGGKSWT